MLPLLHSRIWITVRHRPIVLIFNFCYFLNCIYSPVFTQFDECIVHPSFIVFLSTHENRLATTLLHLTFRGSCIVTIFLLIYFQQDATLHILFISGKLIYMFRVVSPPIIRSTHNCIYSIWYLSNRYCYLPLLWKSWCWFECGVGIVLICFGAVATALKQINTFPTPHSNQLQLSLNSGR